MLEIINFILALILSIFIVIAFIGCIILMWVIADWIFEKVKENME